MPRGDPLSDTSLPAAERPTIPFFALILENPSRNLRIFTMNQSLLAPFGTPIERVETALEALRQGRGVLVVDDEDRENEGDLIFAAESLTNAQMAMLIRECSGIVCLCLTDEKIKALQLPPMVENNSSQFGTAFTVSIEAKVGVTTGVSAADRVTTIKTAIADNAKPEDLARPGHVYPLRAQPGGVMTRRGHTEGTVDLMQLAGLKPAGVLCEVTNPDGTMARLPQIIAFGDKHDLPVLSIEDIVSYRESLLANAG
ncbi:3,4-dihydroxy-2-butanone 4-phosphate synthase [Shewanella algae]|nr:3,4-dihydroxy-2-butanone 4-phosphate synthase [Shewanella algae]GGZ37345.1 3,4-dihydroxy-2-butanone 4-phosphate synthase [Shewanella chilikensis]